MKEKISALMDGELEGVAAEELIDGLRRGGEPLEAWRMYHVAGDAMRDTRLLSEGFAARLSQRLAAEPTVLAPRRMERKPRSWMAIPAAVAASVAGIALVGWLAFAPQSHQAAAPLAQAPAPAAVTTVAKAAKKPARIPLPSATPDYLLAHQGFSPRVSLQGMAPYARTVSDEAIEGRK